MELARIVAAILLAVAVTSCNGNGETGNAENRSPVSTTTTTGRDRVNGTASTAVDGAAQASEPDEVFVPAEDPEVVFTGPLKNAAGSLVVRYEPNSWYRESGIAALPSVGSLQWFIDTEDGCQVVDRSTFIDTTGLGQEITITPTPDGDFSIGESTPLWIEGDWLIHDGCEKGDPIIPTSRLGLLHL